MEGQKNKIHEESNYWLMSMRWGNEGEFYFDDAKKLGLIAIGHYEEEETTLYRAKNQVEIDQLINNPIGQKMLGIFRLDMKIGDIVYIRGDYHGAGANIFGRCTISSDYYYENDTKSEPPGFEYFFHRRKVDWDKDFGELRRNAKEDIQILHKTIAKLDKKKVKEYNQKYDLKQTF